MMNSFVNSMNSAASGMRAQGQRIRHVSENIANVDTPGYHRKVIAFENSTAPGTQISLVKATRVALDNSPLTSKFDPAHPMADVDGNVQMSNVNLMIEMADAREASRSYEANLSTFQQARQMYSSLLDILRR